MEFWPSPILRQRCSPVLVRYTLDQRESYLQMKAGRCRALPELTRLDACPQAHRRWVSGGARIALIVFTCECDSAVCAAR